MQVNSLRRAAVALLAAAPLALISHVADAHHGWGWATDEEFEIGGKIVKVRLGNPHGEVAIDAQGEKWLVEVGQPWRNERAGLTDDMLSIGRMITVQGHRSAKQGERLVKAERVIIDGKSYDLYPDRER